jgi:PAS domain S-box-containing protein
MDELASFLGRNGYLPHGYCITWKPGLLWSMVSADLLIAAAYFSIPLALLTFVRKRGDMPLNWLIGLFCAFIFACGLTHLMEVVTIWQPYYGLQALSKVITAAISLATAIALWPLIPKALKIPSLSQLQSVIASLEAEVKQRRSAEENLADTHEALLITLASIGAGFIACGRDGRVTRMNAVAETITGWRQEAALGQSLWDVFAREERPPEYLRMNPVDVLIQSGSNIDTVHRVVAISRDGAHVPVEVQSALTYSADGIVRGLAMVFRDMTSSNQAEVKASQLAALVESSHDAIIGKTLEGRITSWNHGAQVLFGYSAEEALGQAVQMLIPPDRQHEEMRILAQLSTGVRVPPFETVRQAKDGSLRHVSVTISPIQDAQGKVIGASKIARDISQQIRAEELRLEAQRLEVENRQIQEANRLKTEFLANMSHELRTPLNAIIGFADLMHAGAVPPQSPKHHEFLGHIATSGRHLLQLINDVLDLSKVEAGKLEFFPEAVDLVELVKEVTEILHTSAKQRGVTMHADIDASLTDLVLDPARLRQVLYNYLSNAIKFTPQGGDVTLRAYPQGRDHVRIEVEDTGIGISPNDLPRLFVEFQQLDTGYAKRHQGTGLGLALTRRLVQAQGGSVGARSTLGVGSVFHLVLRRVSSDMPDPLEAASTHRFLVIQDGLAQQTRIAHALTEAGFLVDTAPTGAEAVVSARSQSYDGITLDLRLPDRAGLEVLSSIRDDGLSRSSPVVAMTITAAPSTTASFPITDVLSKPISVEQVVSALGKISLPVPGQAKVMVVDDEAMARDLMRATLQAMGIEAVCVPSGRQALQDIDQHRPDAIILDLMMPDMDGFAVLDALRQSPTWRNTPVFIWTSMVLTDDEYAQLTQSARAILSKGGGALEALLENLRRWRPPAMPLPVGSKA